MSKEKQPFQSALDNIIDGVAVSTVGEGRAEAVHILLEGGSGDLHISRMTKK